MKNKAQYYQAMEKLKWNLPKYKSTSMTIQFLNDIRDLKVYCPKTSNEHHRCSDVP